MRQVASSLPEFCQLLDQVLVQLYVSLSGRRPVMMEAQVSQVSAAQEGVQVGYPQEVGQIGLVNRQEEATLNWLIHRRG